MGYGTTKGMTMDLSPRGWIWDMAPTTGLHMDLDTLSIEFGTIKGLNMVYLYMARAQQISFPRAAGGLHLGYAA
jgi:hypothetical protein